MDDPRGIVERGYDAIGQRYASAAARDRVAGTYFLAFLDRVLGAIPPGGRVLDLGCGSGLVAAEVISRASVVGVDLSLEQLRLARRSAPGAMLVRADMAEVAFARPSFDAVLAFWSLIHVRRSEHARVLGNVLAWLRPGGVFAGTLGSSDNPAEREDFFGAPMYWSHFDAATNARMLHEAGFEVVEAEEIEDAGEVSLWVISRRPA